MPISLDGHDPDIGLTPGTTKSDIVAFLYQNDEYGYSPREIHEELDIPHNTSKVTLKRLYDNEFIEKTPDGYYHARPDRDDLYRYLGALKGLDRLFTDHDAEDSSASEAEIASDESADLSDEDIEEAVALIDEENEDEDEL
jgi:DNA-binding MarR family transcriptional regulator